MSVSSRTDHIQIARVIGIPIYLHFSWLIIFAVVALRHGLRTRPGLLTMSGVIRRLKVREGLAG